jgi:hypothetical protein
MDTVCTRYSLFYIVYSPVVVYENRMVPPSVELVLACMYVELVTGSTCIYISVMHMYVRTYISY